MSPGISSQEGMESSFHPGGLPNKPEREGRGKIRVTLEDGTVLAADSIGEMIEELQRLREH